MYADLLNARPLDRGTLNTRVLLWGPDSDGPSAILSWIDMGGSHPVLEAYHVLSDYNASTDHFPFVTGRTQAARSQAAISLLASGI